jgi:hypothetical protein
MYEAIKYASREEALARAAADQLIAVYIVMAQESNRTRIAFRHLDNTGAIRNGATDGYDEEYSQAPNGEWYWSHCGLGEGCHWTDDEPTDGNQYAEDPVGTAYGIRPVQ